MESGNVAVVRVTNTSTVAVSRTRMISARIASAIPRQHKFRLDRQTETRMQRVQNFRIGVEHARLAHIAAVGGEFAIDQQLSLLDARQLDRERLYEARVGMRRYVVVRHLIIGK